MKPSPYKWIATKGERHQATVGFGFDRKADAHKFATTQNRRHSSGYYVAKASNVKRPSFI